MDDDFISLMIDFEHSFKIIRIIDDMILTSNMKLKAEIIPLSDEIDSDKFEITLSKWKFFIDAILSRSIIFFRDNDYAVDMLIDDEGENRCSNYITLTPYCPTDDHIAGLLQCKLTALSNGILSIGSIKLKSDNSNGLGFRFIGNANELLPNMEEWIGDRTYFDKPWWNRDDASTLDIIPQPDADLNEKPEWAYKLDFIEKTISPQEVVVRADFKPKIIKGGKE